jgi:hypothetical protein
MKATNITRMTEDDLRRMFQANKRASTLSHRAKKSLSANSIWSIRIAASDTCDGSEFQLWKHGMPYRGGFMSWESAFQAIPESER